jgi:hypothetical protein
MDKATEARAAFEAARITLDAAEQAAAKARNNYWAARDRLRLALIDACKHKPGDEVHVFVHGIWRQAKIVGYGMSIRHELTCSVVLPTKALQWGKRSIHNVALPTEAEAAS